MRAQRIIILLLFSVLFSAVSCIREEPDLITDARGLVMVPVGLSLTVDALVDGTPWTKGIMEPDEDATAVDGSDQIANILVLQFDGITSEAKLVGDQKYFDHWPLKSMLDPDDDDYDANDKLTLVPSTSANTVVVMANTFGEIATYSEMPLGEFLAQDFNKIGGLSGVMTTSGGNKYLRLSGSKKLDNVSGLMNVEVPLKRNSAKIIVKVKNASASATPPVTISQVQLRDINAKYYYLAHIGSGLDASVKFSDPLLGISSERFDNAREDFPAANNLGGEYATSVTYTYYVPANLRGTTSNTQQYSKGMGAPEGATRFCIYGTYGTDNTPIVYTYYLGKNLTNDFNIEPNFIYTYNITINSKGNPNYDYRIEDMGEVQFTTDANCYMLHPPTVPGQSRIYAIPVRRAAVFWNESNHDSGVGEYGARVFDNTNYQNNEMGSDTDWDAKVLWSDFDLKRYLDPSAEGYVGDADKFLQVASGSGFDPSNPQHLHPCFKVKVHSGMKGNVVVGITKHGASAILWSWHLWITDYDPDKHVVPVSGRYIYGVENGDIYRCNNDTWGEGGLYEKGFSMDRNLGAKDNQPASSTAYGLLYQWGRKDPFSYSDSFYYEGKSPAVSVLGDGRQKYVNTTGVPGYKNIRYSVENPMIYIGMAGSIYSFTSPSDDLSSSNGIWNDPKIADHVDAQIIWEQRKSIYDPCPYGWKLPISTTYSDLHNNKVETYAETGRTLYADSGRYYYPEGYINRETTGAIYFPGAGERANGNGNRGQLGNAWLWLANPSGATNGLCVYLTRSESYSVYSGPRRAHGYPVRCIRE